jgi:hypothetical protein
MRQCIDIVLLDNTNKAETSACSRSSALMIKKTSCDMKSKMKDQLTNVITLRIRNANNCIFTSNSMFPYWSVLGGAHFILISLQVSW